MIKDLQHVLYFAGPHKGWYSSIKEPPPCDNLVDIYLVFFWIFTYDHTMHAHRLCNSLSWICKCVGVCLCVSRFAEPAVCTTATAQSYIALWIINHWINQENPCSRCCSGKSLFNLQHVSVFVLRYLWHSTWMKIHALNKDFPVRHHERGISWLIQWFFIQSVCTIKLCYVVQHRHVMCTINMQCAPWAHWRSMCTEKTKGAFRGAEGAIWGFGST